jgi:cell division protein FtsQ
MRGRRRRVRALIIAGIVGVLCAVVAGASFTPIFEAEQVLVLGNVHLRARQVRRISGLSIGTNVLHADLDAAERRLERDGWIARATARRELPGTIVVEVLERTPVGTFMADDRPALVMSDGTVLDGHLRTRLPEILFRNGSGTTEGIGAAARALGALSAPVRRQVDAVSIRPDASLVLHLRGGVWVVYGPPVERAPKARALAELLRWADKHSIRLTMLDVTVPQAPTARSEEGALAY